MDTVDVDLSCVHSWTYCCPGSRGEDPQSPAGSRKRPQVRRVEEVCETLQRNPDQRRLRADGGQRRLPQLHRRGRAHRQSQLLQQGQNMSRTFTLVLPRSSAPCCMDTPLRRRLLPCVLQRSMPFELLIVDPQTSQPVRTSAGRCVRARRGDVTSCCSRTDEHQSLMWFVLCRRDRRPSDASDRVQPVPGLRWRSGPDGEEAAQRRLQPRRRLLQHWRPDVPRPPRLPLLQRSCWRHIQVPAAL